MWLKTLYSMHTPDLSLGLCTDFWPCPILGHLFARTRHCYVAAAAGYPRAFARPSDTEESSDLCMVAAGCLGGIWARPLPLGAESLFVGPAMCALTPFVCKSNSAYLTSNNKNFTGTFCKATLQVTCNKLTQFCPKKGFFCSINLV